MSVHRYGKFKVTDKATGEVHYLSADELARMPSRRSAHSWPAIPKDLDRNAVIKLIRDALKKRSGKTWSVTGGRGTAWGWLSIDAPPARRIYDSEGNPSRKAGDGYMGPEDRRELTALLGLRREVHMQGESIASSSNHYREYIARARGETPTVFGKQYWD